MNLNINQILTRFLLIGSAVVFAAGAAVPAVDNFWGMASDEAAKWIAANPGRWIFSSVAFIVSLLLCVAGLAVFNEYLQEDAQPLAKIGFYTFLTGALFWIIVMGFRLSIEPWAARIFVETASAPESFAPFDLLQSKFYDIFMVAAFLASSVYGLALLRSPQFPNSVGWFSVGYGILMAAAHVVSSGPIPVMVLVVPLVLGMLPYPDL